MRARIVKLMAALSALAVLAVGGSSLASAGSKATQQPAKQPAAQRSTADEQPASESPAEQPEAATAESGSEQAANDGPGGHADEPGNPNADHQFEGVE